MKKSRGQQVVEAEEAGIEGVVAALAAIQSKGTFATARTCSSKDLCVELAGVGAIEWPIDEAVVQRLKALARPAPYGKRDKTLVDRKVRDTWEIEPRMLKINTRKWRRVLDAQLALLRDDLGLPSSGELVAELDKMLLYEPGQFFAPHQDSERGRRGPRATGRSSRRCGAPASSAACSPNSSETLLARSTAGRSPRTADNTFTGSSIAITFRCRT